MVGNSFNLFCHDMSNILIRVPIRTETGHIGVRGMLCFSGRFPLIAPNHFVTGSNTLVGTFKSNSESSYTGK